MVNSTVKVHCEVLSRRQRPKDPASRLNRNPNRRPRKRRGHDERGVGGLFEAERMREGCRHDFGVQSNHSLAGNSTPRPAWPKGRIRLGAVAEEKPAFH